MSSNSSRFWLGAVVVCFLGVVVGGSLNWRGGAPVSNGLEDPGNAIALPRGDLLSRQRDALSLDVKENGPAPGPGVLSGLSEGTPSSTAGATGEVLGQQRDASSLDIKENAPARGVLSGLSEGAPSPTAGATGQEGVNKLGGTPSYQPGTPGSGAETAGLPAGFVRLREVDATILQDIRYASANNFTGARVPGYQTGECILRREVAEALKSIQTDLRPHALSLKVYDCYRPLRAVKAFMQWW